MFNLTAVFQWAFGLILIYSGIKMMAMDEEETDPKENCMVQLILKFFPVYEGYAPDAAFFVWTDREPRDREQRALRRVEDDSAREVELEARPPEIEALSSRSGDDVCEENVSESSWGKGGCKATFLLLVVVALTAVDLIFAIDSVTAKISMVAQFDDSIDLVLNFTSSAFTMLTLRSLYFLIASLVPMFRLMKYGVGVILMLIGLRLMFSRMLNISDLAFCILMLTVFGISMLASIMLPTPAARGENHLAG